jgi:hypothetical protein
MKDAGATAVQRWKGVKEAAGSMKTAAGMVE